LSTRSHRDLAALQNTASSSRVLNLALLDLRHGTEPEHRAQPLFHSRQLNTAIIIKHRLRANERWDKAMKRLTATKVIIPFEAANLRIGGQAFFVGETNQATKLRGTAGIKDDDLQHDLRILEQIDALPSLDPFLMREQLRRNNHNAADTYFNISPGDLKRMQAFVAANIKQLVSMAFGMAGGGDSANRIAEALLSTQLDERLEPLRLTLRLEGDAFREGVFCWKGFLYYKWMLAEFLGDVARVVKEVDHLRITGPRDKSSMDYIAATQVKIRLNLRTEIQAARETIADYDHMFDDLVTHSKANAFRDFLLAAPVQFVQLGERLGNAAHVASFWHYRFPDPKHLVVTIEEALDILQDFESSLGDGVAQQSSEVTICAK
jgi:hypothetical protein